MDEPRQLSEQDIIDAAQAEVERLREALAIMLNTFEDSIDPTDREGQAVLDKARTALGRTP